MKESARIRFAKNAKILHVQENARMVVQGKHLALQEIHLETIKIHTLSCM